MKKFSLLFIVLCIASTGIMAQKSAVKLGLGGLLVTAPNLRFEQAVGDRMSFQITGSYKFPSSISTAGVGDNLSLTDPKISGFAIVPEFRFYFGKANAGTIKGFYLAPYLKYHRYGTKSVTSFNYTDPTGNVIPLSPELNLNISTIGAGLQIGYQWIIGDHFSIDWHFLGIGGDVHRLGLKYDFATDDLDLKDVAKFLRDEYNAAAGPDGEIDITDADIDQIPIEGNSIRTSLPFTLPGFRAGLSIGYAF